YQLEILFLKTGQRYNIQPIKPTTENKLHWQLDVILGEDTDRKRTKNSAHNMSLIHKMILNILQPHKNKNKSSIQGEINKCALSDSHRTKILESL
ncbi:MAG TPA: hypothetical protein PK239_18490, partial [Chitinophagales bacterium]|nr:hypothetical protein [Chitinophagales bacterium]